MTLSTMAKATMRSVPVVARDAAGAGGCCLVAYGAWLVYPPAGFITGGILLSIGAFLLGGKRS